MKVKQSWNHNHIFILHKGKQHTELSKSREFVLVNPYKRLQIISSSCNHVLDDYTIKRWTSYFVYPANISSWICFPTLPCTWRNFNSQRTFIFFHGSASQIIDPVSHQFVIRQIACDMYTWAMLIKFIFTNISRNSTCVNYFMLLFQTLHPTNI